MSSKQPRLKAYPIKGRVNRLDAEVVRAAARAADVTVADRVRRATLAEARRILAGQVE